MYVHSEFANITYSATVVALPLTLTARSENISTHRTKAKYEACKLDVIETYRVL